MPLEEKVFKIPLRKEWVKKPRVARVNVSVDVIRGFVSKNMKTEDIKISQMLNESLWVRGAKKPPAFAKVRVVKDDKGIVTAMLPEEKMEVIEKKGLRHKLLRQKGSTETKLVIEEKKETVKSEEKAEVKEAKKPEDKNKK